MNKNYFLLFGTKNRSVESLTAEFEKRIYAKFERRTSSYLGDYNMHVGEYIDKLTVRSNYFTDADEWKEKEFKEYRTVIHLTFNKGKNKDKRTKKDHYRRLILNEMLDVDLLKETCIDEKGNIEKISPERISELNWNSKKNILKRLDDNREVIGEPKSDTSSEESPPQ